VRGRLRDEAGFEELERRPLSVDVLRRGFGQRRGQAGLRRSELDCEQQAAPANVADERVAGQVARESLAQARAGEGTDLKTFREQIAR